MSKTQQHWEGQGAVPSFLPDRKTVTIMVFILCSGSWTASFVPTYPRIWKDDNMRNCAFPTVCQDKNQTWASYGHVTALLRLHLCGPVRWLHRRGRHIHTNELKFYK